MIKVEGLSKFYSGHMAIEGVSFEISKGEIVGLLGLNGAGKSTILKILGCFLMPSAGKATVAGVSVEDDPQTVRKHIGYLPDTPPLYEEMTVESYLIFVAKLKNVESAKVRERVADAMHKTNLGEVGQVAIANLSHGFKQRVGIAQALVHNPPVLILDEPINGLDPVQIVEMRDLILSLRKHHTVILSSHILSEITRTCDRIIIVDRGKLVAEGNETKLQQGLVSSMRVLCEVDSASDALVAAVQKIKGVSAVKRTTKSPSSEQFEVECLGDLRSEIAKAIVGSGAGLLALSRQGAGLEGLFMKFVTSRSSSQLN